VEAAPHPQAFGQILTRTWELMRAHLKLFLAIGAVPAGVLVVVYGLYMALFGASIRYVHRPIGAAGVTIIVLDCTAGILALAAMTLTYALYQPAASYAGLQADAGLMVTFREAYGVAWRKAGRHFWLAILRQLIITGPMIVPVLAFLLCGLGVAAAGKNAVPVLAILGFMFAVLLYLGAIAWAILAMIRLVLAFPACVAGNLTAWESIRRSNRLTQGRMLRIFLVGLVLYAVSYGVVLACEVVFGIVVGLGAIPVMVFHLGPVWWITGLVLLGICFLCALMLLMMGISTSYSVAFAILYREHVRLESMATASGPAG
jgi:hypothetical protein